MMRDKHRYLLVEASSAVREDDREFGPALYRELSRCVGEANMHRVNLKYVKQVDQKTFVLKSSLDGARDLVLALALVKRVNGADIAFYTLKSSGTIKALLSSGPAVD